MQKIRLFIVEDQIVLLKQLVKILSNFDEIEIVGTASKGSLAIKDINKMPIPPHVVLCDLGLPDMSGIDVTKHIKMHNNNIEILAFTIFEDEEKVLKAIHAGASGYLLKGADIEKIKDTIIEVAGGGSVIEPSLARKLLKYFAMPKEGIPKENFPDQITDFGIKRATLSLRELECLQIIAKGLSNHEAASVLNLSKATIRTHLEHVYQKLDVTNRVEAITEAIRQGIIKL